MGNVARPEADASFLLFVASDSPNSRAAIANLERAMALLGRSMDDIAIVNVFEQPELASTSKVFVTPTLLSCADTRRRIFGDLSLGTQLADFLLHS